MNLEEFHCKHASSQLQGKGKEIVWILVVFFLTLVSVLMHMVI